jgi:hypothetical protein
MADLALTPAVEDSVGIELASLAEDVLRHAEEETRLSYSRTLQDDPGQAWARRRDWVAVRDLLLVEVDGEVVAA